MQPVDGIDSAFLIAIDIATCTTGIECGSDLIELMSTPLKGLDTHSTSIVITSSNVVFYSSDVGESNLLPLNFQVASIPNKRVNQLKLLEKSALLQVFPLIVGANAQFNFDLSNVGTLVESKVWIDEVGCLWLRAGTTIGASSSTADLAMGSIQLLFNRLYFNNYSQLYDLGGSAIAKTDLTSDWNANYTLALFVKSLPGYESLICSGILLA